MNLEPGWMTKATYIRTIDGDTHEFEIRRTFKVRVRDLYCPENDSVAGQRDTAKSADILSKAEDILVFVPSNDPVKLVDYNSFARLVGDIWVDGKDFKKLMGSD